MTIKANIIERMQANSNDGSIITDSNNFTRRMFRCWIDGSYLGQAHYIDNCDYARENFENYKALRSFVISQFVQFIAHEHDCSISTAQKAVVESMSTDNLERLNVELVDDLQDLVREEVEAA